MKFETGSVKAIFPIFLCIVCLGVYFGYRYTTDPPGYCRAQDRYISDEEFIQATIAVNEREMSREYVFPDGKKGKGRDVSKMYENWDFDPKNPNCCFVWRTETYSKFNRIFGVQEIEVALNARTTTESIAGDRKLRFQWDVCGTLISGIGLSSTQLSGTPSSVITIRNTGGGSVQ